jgi:subtilase family serine protease
MAAHWTAKRALRRRVRSAALPGSAMVLAATLGLLGSPSGAALAIRGSGVTGGRPTIVVAPAAAVPSSARGLGTVPPSTVIGADVVLAPRDPAGLALLATEISTPGSPQRARYWSPSRLVRTFSPAPARVRAVEAGLRHLGLTIASVTSDRLTVHVVAPAATMARAFGTSFERYRVPGGSEAFANVSPARVPASLGSAVATIIGLSSFQAMHPLDGRLSSPGAPEGATATATGGAPVPCASAVEQQQFGGYTADELASYYAMTGLYRKGDLGGGANVGIVEFERNSPADVAAYEACYGIATAVRYVEIDGGSSGYRFGSGESALDIEDVAGLAPLAHILVYRAPNSTKGVFDELERIVDHPAAKVVTDSWGQCEQNLGSDRSAALSAARAEATLFEYAAAEGQTWLSAAGDEGSSDCYGDTGLPFQVQAGLAVDDPGSQPFMTSVGGTTLDIADRTETVWNSAAQASGGGISVLWPMPSYQSDAPAGLGVISASSRRRPCQAQSGFCREVPDVTADADPQTGYVVYYAGSWTLIGGTSAATPLWAAIAALADESPRCAGRSLGQLNPSLYAVAGSSRYAAAFRDITVGGNDDYATGYVGGRYRAGRGYDMASGLGSPIVTSPAGGLASSLCILARR